MIFAISKNLFKDFLDEYPAGFMAALRFVRRNRPTLASLLEPATEIVIDSFPRSGSSFTCRAFEADSRHRPKVAHHVHHSSHIIEAARLGVPALVLIRRPRDAIVSLKALSIQGAGMSLTERTFPMWLFTRWYVHFYQRLVPHLSSLVLADFSQVRQDVGVIIRRVNDKFGTSFEEFVHTPATQQAIFASNGFHLSPSRERDIIKTGIAAEYDARANRSWAASADRLYGELSRVATI
jgi:hypothetical protein